MHPHSNHDQDESEGNFDGINTEEETGTFSFTDFKRMKEELDFKGNFYETVKRKS